MAATSEFQFSVNFQAINYTSRYQSDLCVGEVIRNCCVNLGIDPDTEDGVTRNISVFRKNNPETRLSASSTIASDHETEWTRWIYNPYIRLNKVFAGDIIELKFELRENAVEKNSLWVVQKKSNHEAHITNLLKTVSDNIRNKRLEMKDMLLYQQTPAKNITAASNEQQHTYEPPTSSSSKQAPTLPELREQLTQLTTLKEKLTLKLQQDNKSKGLRSEDDQPCGCCPDFSTNYSSRELETYLKALQLTPIEEQYGDNSNATTSSNSDSNNKNKDLYCLESLSSMSK